jgi:hypothetical protein
MAEENSLSTLAMTSNGLTPTTIEEAWRYATAISKSQLVTDDYRGKAENCLVLIDLSIRLKVSWFMLMQHLYVIKGKPALDSIFTTAMVNSSGLFVDPIEYEVEGKDVKDKDYRVRAYATRKSTGKMLYGPWITWDLVRGEGWYDKPGSKWKSMPEQMFHYRAASWFQRRICPEITLGMSTYEELLDTTEKPKHVNSEIVESEPKSKLDKFKEKLQEAKQEGIESAENKLESQEIETPPEEKKKRKSKTKEETPESDNNISDEEKLRQAEETAKEKFGSEPEGVKYKCIDCGNKFTLKANEKQQCPKCLKINVILDN